MFNILSKPEYFFCPKRVYWRIKFSVLPPQFGMQKINLIWGRSLIANPLQTIGKSLYTYGLYDLPLTEMICRLVRPGDLVIDAGANIGYTSCLMQDCLAGKGELISFEPLPELFEILKQNLSAHKNGEMIHAHNLALSSTSGNAVITLPQNFANNDGVATLQSGAEGKKIEIQTTTLDSLKLVRNVRLLKMDVEGHEYDVLKGATESLKNNIFENILFEDLDGYKKSKTARLLEENGYKVYKLAKHLDGISLQEPDYIQDNSFEPDNFLATKDLDISKSINQKRDWFFYKWAQQLKRKRV